MPIFIYKAKKGPQEIVEGTVEAGSKEAAVSKVEQMGYVPIKLSLKEESCVVAVKKVAVKGSEHLATRGTVIYLRASVHDLYLRTRFDRNRPLLQNANPQAKLEQLFAARDPFYREVAHHIVDTGNQPVINIVQQIEELLGYTKSEPKI